jgi:hypothetical protein
VSEWWSYVGGKVFFPVDVTGSRKGPWFPTEPRENIEADEPAVGDGLAELAAASEVVVRAEVVAVGPGPEVSGADGARFQLRSVTLRPREIVKGAVATALVRFAEPGYTLDGLGFTVNGVAWSRVGDEGWYFLTRSDDTWMRLVSSYGRFLVTGAEPVADPDAFAEAVRAAVS